MTEPDPLSSQAAESRQASETRVTAEDAAGPVSGEAAGTEAVGTVEGGERVKWADRVRWGLFVVWVVMVMSAVLTGARHGELGDLENAIADGKVTEVRISGEGLPSGATGSVRQDIYWQEGAVRRVVTVVSASDSAQSNTVGGATAIGSEDAAAYLRQAAPDLSIRSISERTTIASVLGWSNLPGVVAGLSILFSLACFAHITLSPRVPWHATRWAWVWLTLTPIGRRCTCCSPAPPGRCRSLGKTIGGHRVT